MFLSRGAYGRLLRYTSPLLSVIAAAANCRIVLWQRFTGPSEATSHMKRVPPSKISLIMINMRNLLDNVNTANHIAPWYPTFPTSSVMVSLFIEGTISWSIYMNRCPRSITKSCLLRDYYSRGTITACIVSTASYIRAEWNIRALIRRCS